MNNLPTEQDEIIIKCSLEKMAKAFFKDYEIIWHDPNVNSQENQQYMAQLEKLCKVQAFTEWKDAENYIKAAKTVCHVITSGTNGELLVKEIFSSANVPNVFTFCRNEEYHLNWTQNYQKVLCTETKIEDVIAQIQKNLLEWQKQTSSLKFDLPAFAPIFDDRDKSQMNHLHFYLKVIPHFKNWKQAKEDFVNLSKRVYSDKKNEKLIEDFEHTYNEYNKEAILKWYTQQSFLYKVINNCLRIATSDSIQWSRLLLKDLEEAIKAQYETKSKNFSGLLYRAAYLSEKEWSSLKANMNKEIEMHGVLSVSKEKSTALKFMGVDPTQKVFITIIVPKGPIEEEQGFAEIDEFSKFPKEKEVLFNARSRFTVLETEDEYSQDAPYRHLVLLYGAQSLRKFTAEENPVQQVSIDDIEKILCSHCQVPTRKMPGGLLFMSIANLKKQIYFCKECLEEKSAPFLCIPVTKKVSTIEIKGCLLINPSQTQIPFYGYKCSHCGVKNQKRYFICTDCSENKMKWCENCLGNPLSCVKMGHSTLLEGCPFSFWCEKMPENELNHLKFQSNLMIESNDVFQRARMFHETHEYEKAIEYFDVYIEQT